MSVFIPFGILTVLRSAQLKNALSPIFVTLSGIASSFILRHEKNALAPISVTFQGIITFSRASHS